jgi:hypothetical protein
MYIQYTYSQSEGEGGELNQREGEWGNRGEYRSKKSVENTNKPGCTQKIGYPESINFDNTCRKVPLQLNFFRVLSFYDLVNSAKDIQPYRLH